MRYNELFTKLTYLTGLNNIKQSDIGELIGMDKAAVNKRAKNNSKFSEDEIKKIESRYNINFSDISVVRNTFSRQNDTEIKSEIYKSSERLAVIQEKNNLSDIEFAKLLGLYVQEYNELKSGERQITLSVLNAVKQNFQVSADWLLYGG